MNSDPFEGGFEELHPGPGLTRGYESTPGNFSKQVSYGLRSLADSLHGMPEQVCVVLGDGAGAQHRPCGKRLIRDMKQHAASP